MKPESSLLPSDWSVPAMFRLRLGESVGRQRVMEADGQLLIVLHAPPGADEAGRRGRYFWRDAEGQWKVAPRAEPVSSLADHLADYRNTIAQLEQAEEAAQSAREYFGLLDQLTPLARSVRNMHRVLQKAREAMPGERLLIVARDDAYELARRAELLYDDAKNGLEFTRARQAEEHAESSRRMAVASHRLNLLVAFFFPIATLMTIFNGKLTHGLEALDAKYGPWVLIALVGSGLVMGILITCIIVRPPRRPDGMRANRPKR